MDKRELRATLLAKLKSQPEDRRRRKSQAIRRKLYRLEAFRRARTVLCYVALPYEVQTWPLITRMLRAGTRVAVPRVEGNQLLLSEVRDPARELAPGAFGVLEPAAGRVRPVRPDAIDLILVPGLAFDHDGHRLGHGYGYFDRLLERLPAQTFRVGVCFDFQLIDHLPTRPHDQAVGQVLAA
jgi:5-formyltetrahydrofolate cyclo-ligase